MKNNRTPLTEEQFNYMIDFAIRQLNKAYYKDDTNNRLPVSDLRLSIKNRIKKLEKMKKQTEYEND
jgi:hypothetical protein